MRWWLLPALLAVAVSAAQANVEAFSFESAQSEQLYRQLIAELRCLVCQNQNLADSNAELAQDLRRKTYEMISSGMGEEAIVDYMVQRYGDFVLYRPPVKGSTLLLWFGPVVLLVAALFAFILMVRRRGDAAGPRTLSDVQRQRVERLLQEEVVESDPSQQRGGKG